MSAGTRPLSANSDIDEIRRALGVLFEPGQVVELRALRGRDVTTGYFDDFEMLALQAAKLSGHWDGIYVTIQRINPALLARRCNRMEVGGKGTGDGEVVGYRWIPLDFDAVRPTDVSSSDEEHELAIHRARNARDWLVTEGFDQWALADSGNGAHLLLPADYGAGEKEKVRAFIAAVAERFSDDAVKVDLTVFNPSRIWKLYGTKACKGDDFKGGAGNPPRPHRIARLLEVQL